MSWNPIGGGTTPSGVIVMWHGLLTTIPSGWVLCDGQNGTPDLRAKFIRGANAGDNPGGTGGSTNHVHADHPALSHSGAGVSAHTGAAVADHAALSHAGTAVSAHTGCAVASHSTVSNKQGSASGTVVTTASHSVTQPASHTVTQPTAHPAQSHVVTQPVDHTVTQASGHAAQSHSSANNEPPYYALAFIMKL